MKFINCKKNLLVLSITWFRWNIHYRYQNVGSFRIQNHLAGQLEELSFSANAQIHTFVLHAVSVEETCV